MRPQPLAVAAALAVLFPAPALACGGFFCMSQPIDQSGERIMFVQDADEVTAHVQIQYQGDARKFSWVVPTPTEPKLGVGSDALFRAVDEATAPRFELSLTNEGDCEFPPMPAMAEDKLAATGGSVRVVSQDQVGPYDTAVLAADDPDALRRWLRANGYTLPPKLDPLLDPYVSGKYYFVALKLQQDRGAGDLQPITMRYHATKPGIPIRLTGIAATPDMGLYVWVLGESRAIPENYRHVMINEAAVDWLSGGGNYKQVVTRAVDEGGGQAFVTDYAGEAAAVQLGFMQDGRRDLARLATLTDPVRFLRAIQDDGYFQRGTPQALAFVKRYVPMPQHHDLYEPQFYSNPEQYRALLRGRRVDAARAARELEETVVKPEREIRQAFARHRYLTRLFTTMSPAEMTQDPTFRFNAYLGKVSNVHKATGVRDCRVQHNALAAPVHVTLENGTTFTIDPGPAGASPVPMPAALRIEQMTTMGPPSVIQDNSAEIAGKLPPAVRVTTAPRGGMGCAHQEPSTTTPQRGSAGEPATYALLLAAWRFTRRRRR